MTKSRRISTHGGALTLQLCDSGVRSRATLIRPSRPGSLSTTSTAGSSPWSAGTLCRAADWAPDRLSRSPVAAEAIRGPPRQIPFKDNARGNWADRPAGTARSRRTGPRDPPAICWRNALLRVERADFASSYMCMTNLSARSPRKTRPPKTVSFAVDQTAALGRRPPDRSQGLGRRRYASTRPAAAAVELARPLRRRNRKRRQAPSPAPSGPSRWRRSLRLLRPAPRRAGGGPPRRRSATCAPPCSARRPGRRADYRWQTRCPFHDDLRRVARSTTITTIASPVAHTVTKSIG